MNVYGREGFLLVKFHPVAAVESRIAWEGEPEFRWGPCSFFAEAPTLRRRGGFNTRDVLGPAVPSVRSRSLGGLQRN